MPMLRDGALENLGEGGKGATQWFMLHALERGLELRFYSEECGELRGVISVREIERVGPTDETAQFEVVLPDDTYRLRAVNAEDRADWMMRLGWEPAPARAPEPVAAEQQPDEEGEPPERPLGSLLVVASCPEMGTLDAEITEASVFDQEVMTKLIELRDGQLLHVAFDRAGTTTSGRSDVQMFELADVLRKQGSHLWRFVIKDTKWFHAYKQMVKMALQQIQSEYPECRLEVVCVNGGNITQVEQQEMPRILEGAVLDCRAKGVPLVYSMRCVDYREIDAMVHENSRDKLYGVHGVAGDATEVDLSSREGGLRCALALLVPALSRHTTLQQLYVYGNQLTALPESIGQLSTLQTLILCGNQLTALPESIGQLSTLQELDLHDNPLTTLPESIGQLSTLRWLDLNDNQLTTLPESIGQLRTLHTLILFDNQLITLPESIGQLSALHKLDLNDNQLTTLPESIGQLSTLHTLDLNDNQLTTLPESIGQLRTLQELYLLGNQLTTLPESIGQLSTLEKLPLRGNQLTALPESIGQLSTLEGLYLHGTQLTTLPESIGQLSTLQELYLDGNQLTTLPESIGQLSTLEKLDLHGNQLTTLPESIGQLSTLEKLWVDGNQLTALPESIGQLSTLQELYLDGNQLTTLPESIGQLSTLQELKLDKKLTTLPKSVQTLKDGGCAVSMLDSDEESVQDLMRI
eukprot:COSAG06_NODE_5634_length_3347_cov_91.948892_2_plen_694_part_00